MKKIVAIGLLIVLCFVSACGTPPPGPDPTTTTDAMEEVVYKTANIRNISFQIPETWLLKVDGDVTYFYEERIGQPPFIAIKSEAVPENPDSDTALPDESWQTYVSELGGDTFEKFSTPSHAFIRYSVLKDVEGSYYDVYGSSTYLKGTVYTFEIRYPENAADKEKYDAILDAVVNSAQIEDTGVPSEETDPAPSAVSTTPTSPATTTTTTTSITTTTTTTTTKETLPEEYEKALARAKVNLGDMAYSQKGLFDRLISEKYSVEAAQYAVIQINADWKAQALRLANASLEAMPTSKEALYDYLLSEQFLDQEARFAVDNVAVNWKEQAVLVGQYYLNMTPFSKEGLKAQLLSDQFTEEEADYAVTELFK